MLTIDLCAFYLLLTVEIRCIIMAYWKRCGLCAAPPRKGENGMAISKAQQKAVAKYETKAYDKTLIRLPKGRLDEVRAHIEPAGESLNGFIGRAIMETMERDGAGGPQEATGAAAVSLPPDALKAAQRAAERTGEAVVDFLARAAQAQAKQDEISLHTGVNPATGGKLDSKGGADHE